MLGGPRRRSFAIRRTEAGYSRHRTPEPLDTQSDAEAALDQTRTVPFDLQVGCADGVAAEFIPAGHLLGAARIRLSLGMAQQPPRMTYVTHGEPAAADAPRFRIEHELNWPVRAPEHRETVRLDAEK